ncbi:hypothetical protein [Luteimicrobium subarcticum]|uniref:FtsX-like permease family protein n=1 Tax=Luteimicrobium subarcticum TaxID=620910 RepID=A0A2M8WJD1_9MICO|nr:hypothetical protein [Luteimicrobium subarcticum]PJI91023.1 hypothetical protein CLV34_2282 [Luteimicrobium subarcticum]
MTAVATAFRLGVRLALVREAAHRWRQVSLVVAGLLTTLALTFAWSFVHAAVQAEHRELARSVVVAEDSAQTDLQMVQRAEFWDKRQIPVVWLYASGPDAPVPPGLDRLPDPGTFVVSPAVLRSGAAAGLGMTLSDAGSGAGGTIGDEGLRARSEQLVYAAPDASHTLASGGSLVDVASFGVPSSDAGLSPANDSAMPSSTVAAYSMVWLVVIPALMFLLSCSVALSGLRDRRSQSLHAIGLSPAQVRGVGAVEAGSLVAVGSVVGGALWWIGGGRTTTIPLTGIVVVDRALAVPWTVALSVALLAVAMGTVLGASTIRVAGPRAAKARRRVSAWGVLPLLVSVVGMVAGKVMGRQGVPVLLGCLLVMTVSLPLALPWLVARLGAAVSRGGSSAGWLAGRRLVHAPVALARPAVAVAVLVFTLGSATGLYVLMVAPQDELGPPVYSFDWRDPRPGDLAMLNDRLAEIDGTAAQIVDHGGSQVAWFATCDDAARAAGLSACTDAGGKDAALERAGELLGVQARIGKAPAQDAASSYVVDTIVVTRSDRTVEDVTKVVNFLPAANLSRLGPEPIAPPLTANWLGGGAIVAATFLLLCALHSFGNRSLAVVGEDFRLLGVGVELRQVLAVQRAALLVPLVVAVPAAGAGALLFTWASSDVDLAASATGQILVEAVVVTVVSVLFALLVGVEQKRRLVAGARALA